jgi:hypothetical protein
MASGLAEQNSGLQVADFSMKCLREFAEQSLNQTKSTLVGFWNINKKMAEDLEKQSSAVRIQTIALAEKTLLNTLDLWQKWVSAREFDGFIQLQSEFVSRMAHLFSEPAQGLGEEARQAAQQAMLGVYDRVLETTRRGENEHSSKADQSPRRQRG